MSGVRFNLVLH
jgi:hypothetical protein